MLNKNQLLENVKVRLGYPVIDLAITDDMLLKQIDFAIQRVAPYLNNIEMLTVSGKVVKFEHKKVYAVLRVTSASDLESAGSIDKAINYGLYITNSTHSIKNMAVWNYYTDTIQDDLNPIGFRLIGDTLYIDGGNSPWTVEAITENSISTMTEDYVNWILDYSVALAKCIEGEIRSKVKITGSPVEMNGSELKAEGITEKKELEEKLGTSLGLFYATR